MAGDIFKDLNREFLTIHLNDVIIYIQKVEEHREHVKKLLLLLSKLKLLAKGSKCSVGQEEVYFLRENGSEVSIRVDKALIKAMDEWTKPKVVKEVQKFRGLSGYQRKFLRGYAHIARKIPETIRNNTFKCVKEKSYSFQALKKDLISKSVIAIYRMGVPFIVTKDSSTFAMGTTMEQERKTISYITHRLSESEISWNTGYQELL